MKHYVEHGNLGVTLPRTWFLEWFTAWNMVTLVLHYVKHVIHYVEHGNLGVTLYVEHGYLSDAPRGTWFPKWCTTWNIHSLLVHSLLRRTWSLSDALRGTWFPEWRSRRNILSLRFTTWNLVHWLVRYTKTWFLPDNKIMSWGLTKTINYYVEHGSLSISLRATYVECRSPWLVHHVLMKHWRESSSK